MSWNYRVVKEIEPKTNETYYQIHEVYYNNNGDIAGFGEAPVPYGETKAEVRECLNLMLKALDKEVIDMNNYK